METENIKMLEMVIAAIGENGSAVVQSYTYWFVISSISWLIFGAGMIAGILRWKITDETFDGTPEAAHFIKCFIVFVGAVICASQIPDLLSPKAAAIHQLLGDIL